MSHARGKSPIGDALHDANGDQASGLSIFAGKAKPKSVEEVQGQYMGLVRVTPEGWGELLRVRAGLSAAECDLMHMTGSLQKVIEEGRLVVHAIAYEQSWGEIDSVGDLLAYQEGSVLGDRN